MGSYCACALSWPLPQVSIRGVGQKDRSSEDENEVNSLSVVNVMNWLCIRKPAHIKRKTIVLQNIRLNTIIFNRYRLKFKRRQLKQSKHVFTNTAARLSGWDFFRFLNSENNSLHFIREMAARLPQGSSLRLMSGKALECLK